MGCLYFLFTEQTFPRHFYSALDSRTLELRWYRQLLRQHFANLSCLFLIKSLPNRDSTPPQIVLQVCRTPNSFSLVNSHLLEKSSTRVAQLPDGTSADLAPSAHDAFAIFQDLCLLANSERPLYLNLEALPKTFSLELIESVLTNYHELFRNVSLLIMADSS